MAYDSSPTTEICTQSINQINNPTFIEIQMVSKASASSSVSNLEDTLQPLKR